MSPFAVWLASIILTVPHQSPSSTAQAEALTHKAEATFGSLKFAEATALYEEARLLLGPSPWLDFNIGTSALAEGKMGSAILRLRQGQALAPRSEGIRHNLQLARDKRQDVIDEKDNPAYMRLAESMLGRLVPEEQWVFFGLLLAITFFFVPLAWRTPTPGPLIRLASMASLTAATGLGATMLRHAHERTYVVMDEEVVVRASTHPDSLVRFRLHAGAEVYRLDRAEGWLRIRIDARRDGWAHADHFCPIQEALKI